MKIAVSIGDVNGIGLECFAKALDKLTDSPKDISFVLFGPHRLILNYLDELDLNFEETENGIKLHNYHIDIKNRGIDASIEFGQITGEAGQIAADSIADAVKSIKAGDTDLLLTLPINKKAISLSGFNFPGHTEMLGESFGADPLMILFSGDVRVALATVHEPIHNVPHLLTPDLIENKYAALENSLRQDFGIANPRIAILGLNPHAGEQGNIGFEEVSYINDTIEKLNIRHDNSTAEGPFPADGFFGFGQYKDYDGILAMYHDQGLIPLKLLAQGGGVNFTANLSIVRVSPDHGTAYPIAGTKTADETSTLEAIQSGITMIENRSKVK
jgi:4-hydroxythreonine-4-phosphate dehydrogenase